MAHVSVESDRSGGPRPSGPMYYCASYETADQARRRRTIDEHQENPRRLLEAAGLVLAASEWRSGGARANRPAGLLLLRDCGRARPARSEGLDRRAGAVSLWTISSTAQSRSDRPHPLTIRATGQRQCSTMMGR